MPGPAEFYGGVRPPTYPSPEPINFNVLGDLLQAYQQGQQYARQRELQTMFQPGTPGAAALSQAGIDPNSLYGLLARSGGAETVAPFAQQLQRGQIYQNIMRGAPGFQSPVGPQSSAEPQEGPNANVASALKNAIYGQESNYGRNPSTSSAGAVGPMQILPSTFAAYAQPGENIRDPIANKNVGDRILDNYLAKYNGDWARAAVAYYSGEGNVAPPGSPTPWKINKQPRSGPSVAGYVQQVGARMRGAGQGANAGTATGTSAPAPNESVGQNIGSPPPFAPMLAAAQSTNAAGPQNIKLTSASGDLSGMLLSPQEPASEEVIPTSSMEVASNQGQGAGASPVAGPITPGGRDTLSQAPTPQTGRPQPSGSYQVAQAGGALPSAPVAGQLPGNEYTPQVAERYRAAARRLRAFTVQSGIAGAASGLKVDTKAYEDQANEYDKRADAIDKVLSERAKEEFGVGIAGRKKQAETDVEQYSNLHKGLAGAAEVAANSLQYTQIAKGLIDDPNFYSGSGENLNLLYKRALSTLGIEPGAALPQEVFRKVMAANINQQINALRAEAETMGEKGGRVFRPMIDLMEKAAQNPDNSVAANRYLTELALRSANRTLAIANMADDYKLANGALDAGFEKQLRNWIVKNPLLTKEEIANPRLIGTPGQQQQQAPAQSIPQPPASLPPGSQYSPSRKQWRDPDGRLYDAAGRPMGA